MATSRRLGKSITINEKKRRKRSDMSTLSDMSTSSTINSLNPGDDNLSWCVPFQTTQEKDMGSSIFYVVNPTSQKYDEAL